MRRCTARCRCCRAWPAPRKSCSVTPWVTAVCGGVAALKALGGPFGNIRFCPTGGVNARNARDYLAQSNVMCVGGTWMVDAKAVRAGDWAAIESATRQALQALDSAAPAELPRDFDLRAERAEQREL